MNKKKTSRFDELIDAARSRQKRDNPQDSSEENVTFKSKSTDPDYVRTTVYLPKKLHRKLKLAAAADERQMSDIISELLEKWLDEKS
ncbi:MAG: CopG family transcriptional regulator [Richelia sp. RM2_1_2]|nr:CopG family transcriptional regulator [Richelia sp. SM2_1_7]NJM23171.1 CopG family transcriptional regulator [Richelia sp. SM1_7_0]NJN07330.1 CopG family transcriptional regulator [Richelia sp. RM1_1_1]NJO30981.1 CopG family transcriptional regulator [Richelia sp. SL_2_1]NJO64667.1 CopG family transcriptional regulator [Richelia sp. RM2_1_2]NJS16449.1 CopG family transcriptional regulator [Nostocaceae cyanobacterium CSU_2_110]